MTQQTPDQSASLGSLVQEPDLDEVGQYNADVLNTWGGLFSSFGILNVGDPVKETKLKFNAFALAPADYGGFKLEKPFTRIRGIAPGVRFTRPVNIHESAEIVGADFIGGADNSADLMVVNSGVVRLIGCTFRREATGPTQTIVVEDGANIVLIGCLFTGTESAAGDIIRLVSGVATDGYVIGCHRTYGAAFGGTSLGSF